MSDNVMYKNTIGNKSTYLNLHFYIYILFDKNIFEHDPIKQQFDLF